MSVGGGSPKKMPVPGEKGLDGGVLANVKRLWLSPTLTLVFSTSPPISTLPIERLTVTNELRASRLARKDEMASELIVTLSIPRPNEMFRDPEGATKRTFLVWPPI